MLRKNNKGFILVVAYMIVVVMVILGTAFSARTIGERRVADKARDSAQALWLAEAGVDRAIKEFPNSPLSGTIGSGSYSTQTTSLTSTRYLINSSGGVPGITSSDPNNSIRKIRVIVEPPAAPGAPGDVTSAITANGNVTIKGSADVNGDVDANAVFDFEEIFNMTKEAVREGANHLYTDPENNITPVERCTWVDLNLATEMMITDTGWTGNGILVVNGDLVITGGHFSGIIWVIGTLRVSGNPIIDGAIFVESGAEFETTLTGNPTVSFDGDAVAEAFGYRPSDSTATIMSWKED